ncbi:MAG: GNAT family N-acetyltransferase [Saprospiraceae bacterium]|nr:GNAT family N-acetyltransferase [Saprospiraceae bacterium]
MTISFYKTNDISESLFESFVKNFNFVFDRELESDNFKKKYLSSYVGHSYHSFLIKDDQVVGACNFIPYEYTYGGEKLKLVLAVGVYIHPDHRSDPLSLLKMYNVAKKNLALEGFEGVIAVPNDVAYQYWKSLVKWQDIGDIPYYILPLDVSKLFGYKCSVKKLNILGANTLLTFNRIITRLRNFSDESTVIKIVRSDQLLNHRYIGDYKSILIGNSYTNYRIINENGVNTCYLIDFHNNKNIRDLVSLVDSLSYIIKNEKVDAIIYAGRMNFTQFCMIKVPKSKEPKRLPLCIGFINPNILSGIDVLNINKWDFGLFNFDIR